MMDSFNHSPVLFVKQDGYPMEFYSYYTGEDKETVMAMIEHGGGTFHPKHVPSAVCLVDLGDNSVKKGVGEVAVSMKFIWDCVERNHLFNMKDYQMIAPKPFGKEEDITIIKYVLKNAEYPHMALDQFYQSVSVKRVLKRDLYAVKSRAKRIYYLFDSYKITEGAEKKFKSVIKPALMYGSYCENDDYVILNFLKSRIPRLHLKGVYDEMVKQKILNYSSESLYHRALKLILPNIDLYDVTAEFKSDIKKHLSKIYNIKPESSLKDYIILHYMFSRIKYMRNIMLYKEMEKMKLLSDSAEYMQLRFLYYILPRIDTYDIPTYFKKRFEEAKFDGFSIFYEEPEEARRRFTKDEDYVMIHFLRDRKVKLSSQAPYREMKEARALNRSALSMYLRFTKTVIPNIDSYDVPDSWKFHFKKACNFKKVQSKSNKQTSLLPGLDNNDPGFSDSEVSTIKISDIPSEPGDTINNVENSVKYDDRGEETCQNPPPAGSSKRSSSVSSRSSISSLPTSPVASRKRRCVIPLPDSDTDSIVSAHSYDRSHVESPQKATSNRRKSSSKVKPQKNKVTYKETAATYAGDIFSYFLSQRSLPDDASDDISAFLSQNSLVSSTSARGTELPSAAASPCFLQAVLDRCQAPACDDDSQDSDSEKTQSNVEDHFPAEVKMKFMSRAIALLQNIEHNVLFQECVHDSLFYQKLVFKVYRINSTVYKNFVAEKVQEILKKSRLTLTDKAFLIKYLHCIEKVSPENPLEVFTRCKLR